LTDRLAYLETAGWGWRLSWLAWVPAGAALIWLFHLARRRLGGGLAASVAEALAGAALAVDATCDVTYAWVMPRLAGEGGFHQLDRALALGSFTLANGLYSAATLLMALGVARRLGARDGWAQLATALPLVATGTWMAVLGATGEYAFVPYAAGATIVCCGLWGLHLAWSLTRR
jgi:hypothetical protein